MNFEQLDNRTQSMVMDIVASIAESDLSSVRDKERLFQYIANYIGVIDRDLQDAVAQELVYEYFRSYDASGRDLNSPLMAINSDGSIKSSMNKLIHVEAVESLIEDTMFDLRSAYRTFEESATGSIDNALQELRIGTTNRLVTGMSKEDIAKRVQRKFLEEGVTAFITRDNKHLPIDFYSRMVVNTKLSQAGNRGHLTRYTESGVDLVEITGHPFCCSHCAAYQGMVYSISGNHPVYPQLPQDLLPIHPNCRDTYSPVIENSLTPSEEKRIKERVAQGVDYDARSQNEVDKYEESQAINRRNNAEKKLFHRMQTELGSDMPESLGAFRRMKRGDTLKYRELYSNYLSAVHSRGG